MNRRKIYSEEELAKLTKKQRKKIRRNYRRYHGNSKVKIKFVSIDELKNDDGMYMELTGNDSIFTRTFLRLHEKDTGKTCDFIGIAQLIEKKILNDGLAWSSERGMTFDSLRKWDYKVNKEEIIESKEVKVNQVSNSTADDID